MIVPAGTQVAPQYASPFFIYGVHYQMMQFGIFTDELEISENFPVFQKWELAGLDQDRYSLYCREKDHIVYRVYPHEEVYFKDTAFSSALAERMWLMRYLPKIHDNDWRPCLALYHDYLAAMEEEGKASRASSKPLYIYSDQREANGLLRSRRLIYILYSPVAARYFMRQARLWQQSIWQRRSIYARFNYTAFSRCYTAAHIEENEISTSLWVDVEYPHARNKKSFRQKWQWHVSPLPPASDNSERPPREREEADRETYHPGDPRILRETGSGQFGSYPSFEGDDESDD